MKKIRWTDLKHIGIFGMLGFFWKPEFKMFFLFYLLSFVEIYNNAKKSEPGVESKKINRYFETLMLSMFNPLMFPLIIKQAFGQIIILFRNVKGFPNQDNFNNKTEYILPFNNYWKVVSGGSIKKNSHSWDIFTQRYAYDFVITNNDISYKNNGSNIEDYYCFGHEVLSPANGEVIRVSNKIKDYQGVGDLSLDWRARDFRGNFIIIKHDKREYSFIAHFKLDSIKVKEGDHVIQGQIIGQCGNSGHSTEPHIHFHLQDSRNFWIATGLPIKFKKVTVKENGSEPVIRTHSFIEKNEIVSNGWKSADVLNQRYL
ncbi:MAG TPA: M23 family metallopeptidase [Cyclobacteriaceae bacterium]|jgi:hypothetical protein|nr:M23 family metallopeptidase [Cyclobacteriaceae bacterium]